MTEAMRGGDGRGRGDEMMKRRMRAASGNPSSRGTMILSIAAHGGCWERVFCRTPVCGVGTPPCMWRLLT